MWRHRFLEILSGQPNYDPSASAYFAAGAIVNPTERSAANTLISNFKSSGIWDLKKRIYLMSPTSVAASRLCCKTLTTLSVPKGFSSSGPTFSTSGLTFNGASDVLQTDISPDSMGLIAQNQNYSTYIRTQTSGTTGSFGGGFAGTKGAAQVNLVSNSVGDPVSYAFTAPIGTVSISFNDIVGNPAQGLLALDCTPSLSLAIRLAGYLNGSSMTTLDSSNGTSASPSVVWFLGCRNNNSVGDNFWAGQMAYAALGLSHGATLEALEYSYVLAYQSALGRK